MYLAVIPNADPLPLPSPAWLLWALLMLTWIFHVIAMNFVLGGSIIAVAAPFNGGHHVARMNAWIRKLMPTSVAAAITFGVAPLLFVQALYGRLFFSSSVLMAWSWFAVVPILIVAYYGTYVLSIRGEKLGRAAGAIGISTAALFLLISLIYTNNMTLMLRPETFLTRYLQDARGLSLNLSDPTLVPRWLHMVFGAIAVAAIILALYGAVARRSDDEYGSAVMRSGAEWFVGATVINVITGAWWTAALPREVLARFMAGRGIVLLTAGIVLGITSLVLLLALRRSLRPERLLHYGGSALVATLIAMALTRDQVRRGMLQLADFRIAERVQPQWDVIALFAILLVAAVAATVWMIAMLLRSRTPHEERTAEARPVEA